MGTPFLSVEARAVTHYGSVDLSGNGIGSVIPNYIIESVTYVLDPGALYELTGFLDHLIQRHLGHCAQVTMRLHFNLVANALNNVLQPRKTRDLIHQTRTIPKSAFVDSDKPLRE